MFEGEKVIVAMSLVLLKMNRSMWPQLQRIWGHGEAWQCMGPQALGRAGINNFCDI